MEVRCDLQTVIQSHVAKIQVIMEVQVVNGFNNNFFSNQGPARSERIWLEYLFNVKLQICLADGDGRLTGADAVPFFKLSGLPQADLRQVRTLLELMAGAAGLQDPSISTIDMLNGSLQRRNFVNKEQIQQICALIVHQCMSHILF